MNTSELYFRKESSFHTSIYMVLEQPSQELRSCRLWLSRNYLHRDMGRLMLSEVVPISIPCAEVQAISEEIMALHLGFSTTQRHGRDGTSYELAIGHVPRMKLSWWQDLPPEWIELRPIVNSLLELAKRHGIDHESRGMAKLYKQPDGSMILRLNDFYVEPGPDMYIFVAKAADIHQPSDLQAGYLELSKLKGSEGNQNYPLPDDFDPALYNNVVIWCEEYQVLMAVAPIQ